MYTVFNANNRGTRRWLDLSQEHGFLLLAPNGVGTGWFGIGKQTKGSANWNDLRDFGSSEDDVGFLVKVIEWAVSERNVDPSRVYFTGASNGGMMTYRMLIERPDVVAAGAALIANLPGEEIDFAPPTSPTPIFLMNGSEDPLVPFEGGVVGRNRGTVRSSTATRDYFVQVNAAGSSAGRGVHTTRSRSQRRVPHHLGVLRVRHSSSAVLCDGGWRSQLRQYSHECAVIPCRSFEPLDPREYLSRC